MTTSDENGRSVPRRDKLRTIYAYWQPPNSLRSHGQAADVRTQRSVHSHLARESSCCIQHSIEYFDGDSSTQCSGFRESKLKRLARKPIRAAANYGHCCSNAHNPNCCFPDCKRIVVGFASERPAGRCAGTSVANRHKDSAENKVLEQRTAPFRYGARCNLRHGRIFFINFTSAQYRPSMQALANSASWVLFTCPIHRARRPPTRPGTSVAAAAGFGQPLPDGKDAASRSAASQRPPTTRLPPERCRSGRR